MDLDRVTGYFQRPRSWVQAAYNYYEAYRDEIDPAIHDNRTMTYEKLSRLLPHIDPLVNRPSAVTSLSDALRRTCIAAASAQQSGAAGKARLRYLPPSPIIRPASHRSSHAPTTDATSGCAPERSAGNASQTCAGIPGAGLKASYTSASRP